MCGENRFGKYIRSTMKNINEFISSIISEAALDARIPDGMVDLKNIEHIQVVAEVMYNTFENEEIVNEFINAFINEGKYPDRQAFNKEGWLVTFPSKEYRDAAIKKGTHAISDPTHGKGGMNLYYKKKGKQKRQTQQAATQTQALEKPVAPKTPPPTTKPSAPKAGEITPAMMGDEDTDVKSTPSSSKKPTAPVNAPDAAEKSPETQEKPKPTSSSEPSAPETPEAPKPAETPAVDVPVVTELPAQYADISKKFAVKKGWMAEPYGEYRDAEGNTVAVVGLSGEVVPVKNNDREEYKLFAEKSKA
jgi:hypothetical protein